MSVCLLPSPRLTPWVQRTPVLVLSVLGLLHPEYEGNKTKTSVTLYPKTQKIWVFSDISVRRWTILASNVFFWFQKAEENSRIALFPPQVMYPLTLLKFPYSFIFWLTDSTDCHWTVTTAGSSVRLRHWRTGDVNLSHSVLHRNVFQYCILLTTKRRRTVGRLNWTL